MNILAMQSSGDQTSVSVMLDEEINSFSLTHARKDRPDWDMFLSNVGFKRDFELKDIDLFAFGNSQNSYTATRTIASYMKGIAVALDKPLIVIDENSNDEFQADVVVKLAKEKFLSAGSDAKALQVTVDSQVYAFDTSADTTATPSSISFIINQQNKTTGYIGTTMYNHGFATLALAEAYGAVEDDRLGPSLEKAISLIVTSQKKNPRGGWRYSPESTDADTTVSGAQMVALFAARNAGLAVPETAIQKGLKYFKSCQTPEGGFGYTSNRGPNAARTAIATLVFALAKEKDSATFKKAFNYLRKAPESSSYRQYYLYYGAQAFFHASPQEWNKWNRKNITKLKQSQNEDGSWGGQFGTTFSTSASLLSIALNYRFLPIYER